MAFWTTIEVLAIVAVWADAVLGTGDLWLPLTLMAVVAGGMGGFFIVRWIKARWELTELRNRRLDD
jgi:uncharacterized membrane protein